MTTLAIYILGTVITAAIGASLYYNAYDMDEKKRGAWIFFLCWAWPLILIFYWIKMMIDMAKLLLF